MSIAKRLDQIEAGLREGWEQEWRAHVDQVERIHDRRAVQEYKQWKERVEADPETYHGPVEDLQNRIIGSSKVAEEWGAWVKRWAETVPKSEDELHVRVADLPEPPKYTPEMRRRAEEAVRSDEPLMRIAAAPALAAFDLADLVRELRDE